MADFNVISADDVLLSFSGVVVAVLEYSGVIPGPGVILESLKPA